MFDGFLTGFFNVEPYLSAHAQDGHGGRKRVKLPALEEHRAEVARPVEVLRGAEDTVLRVGVGQAGQRGEGGEWGSWEGIEVGGGGRGADGTERGGRVGQLGRRRAGVGG